MTEIRSTIESILSQKIIRIQTAGGGCIADNYILYTEKRDCFFLKTGGKKGMFSYEANGLLEISKSNTIRVPHVIKEDPGFLLMEFIQTGPKKEDFFTHFGQLLAQMHQCRQPVFGFFEDNYIGATRQINLLLQESHATDWCEFYFTNRLLYQYKLAEQNGYVSSRLKTAFRKLESKINHILGDVQEAPSLLHGDLWSGNYLCDTQNNPVLIDPAVYYGHRETDLAMTKLFGGFSPDFYDAYHTSYPLAEGWEYRENIYKLYHILNHLNLFGRGYLSEAENLAEYYL
ncbi:MAG: fructosamine kinase family protein [Tannerellaceae bacterium]|nr:fructosamine kinase family protein [Tannerellaceae bacterium]